MYELTDVRKSFRKGSATACHKGSTRWQPVVAGQNRLAGRRKPARA